MCVVPGMGSGERFSIVILRKAAAKLLFMGTYVQLFYFDKALLVLNYHCLTCVYLSGFTALMKCMQ